jgi:uncharacterized protein YkwD
MRAFDALLAFALLAGSAPQATGAAPDLQRGAESIVQRVNDLRRREGGAPLAVEARLTEAASSFAAYMARTERLSHAADGREPAERARQSGYQYCMVAENIAFEYNSAGFGTEDLARQFVQGWERSPGHRANMLHAQASETGVAVAHNARSGRYYAVQLFGRPKSQAVRFQIVNRTGTKLRYQIADRAFSLDARQIGMHEECGAGPIAFRQPGNRGTATLTPHNGERIVVAAAGDRLVVGKE